MKQCGECGRFLQADPVDGSDLPCAFCVEDRRIYTRRRVTPEAFRDVEWSRTIIESRAESFARPRFDWWAWLEVGADGGVMR